MNPDPFTALGLPARPDLDDETVRAAWRTIDAATHPDRPTAATCPATPRPAPPTPNCALRGDARRPTPTSSRTTPTSTATRPAPPPSRLSRLS